VAGHACHFFCLRPPTYLAGATHAGQQEDLACDTCARRFLPLSSASTICLQISWLVLPLEQDGSGAWTGTSCACTPTALLQIVAGTASTFRMLSAYHILHTVPLFTSFLLKHAQHKRHLHNLHNFTT